MTILEGVMLEEYDRCNQRIAAFKRELKEKDPSCKQYPGYRLGLKNARKDKRMLRRALWYRLLIKRWKEKE